MWRVRDLFGCGNLLECWAWPNGVKIVEVFTIGRRRSLETVCFLVYAGLFRGDILEKLISILLYNSKGLNDSYYYLGFATTVNI
jgi:hypothetical protein